MIFAVVGPTAAGKSDLAMRLAEERGGAIVSVDSMQVYRGLDIGTAKATREDRERIPHYMIDLVEPDVEYSVSEFQGQARGVLSARTGVSFIVGGSGFHFRAIVDPMEFPPTDPELRERIRGLGRAGVAARLLEADPDAAKHVDMANHRRVVRALEILELTGHTPTYRARRPEAVALRDYRPTLDFAAIGFDPGNGLAARVEERCDAMLDGGLLAEVAELKDRLGVTARQAVGYKELFPVVASQITIEEGRDDVIRATLALAKRQRTFFRRDPRIRWLPWRDALDDRVQAAREAFEEAAAWTS